MHTQKVERMLGIDPGYDRLGYAILEEHYDPKIRRKRPVVVFSGCIVTNRQHDHATRLMTIAQGIRAIVHSWKPDRCSVESLFFSTNQKTATKVAEARGVILLALRESEIEIEEYTPMQIKVAVTGYGKSDKKQITRMVETIVYFIDQNKKRILDDEYDAIAIALTGLARTAHRLIHTKKLQK